MHGIPRNEHFFPRNNEKPFRAYFAEFLQNGILKLNKGHKFVRFAICGPNLLRFTDLKLMQVHKYVPFLLTNIAYKAPIKISIPQKICVKRRLLGLF
jgi:hypothetical protein